MADRQGIDECALADQPNYASFKAAAGHLATWGYYSRFGRHGERGLGHVGNAVRPARRLR